MIPASGEEIKARATPRQQREICIKIMPRLYTLPLFTFRSTVAGISKGLMGLGLSIALMTLASVIAPTPKITSHISCPPPCPALLIRKALSVSETRFLRASSTSLVRYHIRIIFGCGCQWWRRGNLRRLDRS